MSFSGRVRSLPSFSDQPELPEGADGLEAHPASREVGDVEDKHSGVTIKFRRGKVLKGVS